MQDGVTGYVVPDQDPAALCERLSLLLGDSALRATLGRQAAEYARGYAWENIARQLLTVYQDVLQG